MVGGKVAIVYASALLEIGQEKNILEQIEEELMFLSELIEDDKGFLLYLNTPGISDETKKDFIDKVFKDKLSETTISFLKLLVDNGRQSLIGSIHESLIELIDEVNNRERVTVISSIRLEGNVLEKLKGVLEKKYEKEIILTEKIDESILGGIVLKIGDLIIDGSLANDLRKIQSNLLNRKFRSEASYED